MARVLLLIKGRVQGVGFRYSVFGEATRLDLTGWVRNTRDGHVEIVAEGRRDDLEHLVTWCHRGPRGALVIDVVQQWLAHTGEFEAFRITH